MAWLSGWRYRKPHEIVGSTAGEVTNYQIRITVHYGSGTDSGEHVYLNGKCRTDFGDIRFTSDDGVTELSYWMEEKVDGDYAIFWVKVPSIPASPDAATIYIYYGNPTATTTSNGDNTFEQWFNCDTDPFTTTRTGDGITHVLDTSVVFEGSASVKMIAEDASLMCLDWADLTSDKRVIMFLRKDSASTGLTNINLGKGGGTYTSGAGPYMNLRPDGSLDAWDGTTKHTIANAFRLDAWQRWEIIIHLSSKTWDLYIDGVQKVSGYRFYDTSITSIATLETGNPSGTAANVTSIQYYDAIAIAKYIDPEPTHGAWGSEETAIKVWDGSQWKNITEIKYWDGSTWQTVSGVYYWDGTQWVKVW